MEMDYNTDLNTNLVIQLQNQKLWFDFVGQHFTNDRKSLGSEDEQQWLGWKQLTTWTRKSNAT